MGDETLEAKRRKTGGGGGGVNDRRFAFIVESKCLHNKDDGRVAKTVWLEQSAVKWWREMQRKKSR